MAFKPNCRPRAPASRPVKRSTTAPGCSIKPASRPCSANRVSRGPRRRAAPLPLGPLRSTPSLFPLQYNADLAAATPRPRAVLSARRSSPRPLPPRSRPHHACHAHALTPTSTPSSPPPSSTRRPAAPSPRNSRSPTCAPLTSPTPPARRPIPHLRGNLLSATSSRPRAVQSPPGFSLSLHRRTSAAASACPCTSTPWPAAGASSASPAPIPLLLEPLFNDPEPAQHHLRPPARRLALRPRSRCPPAEAKRLSSISRSRPLPSRRAPFPPGCVSGSKHTPTKSSSAPMATPIRTLMGWEESTWIASHNGREALGLALTGMLADGEITRRPRKRNRRSTSCRDTALSLYPPR